MRARLSRRAAAAAALVFFFCGISSLRAGTIRFGPVSFTPPAGFVEAGPKAPEGAVTPWERLEIGRKRMRVFYDPKRKTKIDVCLWSKGIAYPPKIAGSDLLFRRFYCAAFFKLFEGEFRDPGWGRFSSGYGGPGVEGVVGERVTVTGGLEMTSRYEAVLAVKGEEFVVLRGEGEDGFDESWEAFLKSVSIEKPEEGGMGKSLLSLWSILLGFGLMFLLAVGRYMGYRERTRAEIQG